MAKSQSRKVKTITPQKAAATVKLAIKLTKSGLMDKKPEVQKKAATKEATRRAMEQQIAKLKQLGIKPEDIKAMLTAMAEKVT